MINPTVKVFGNYLIRFQYQKQRAQRSVLPHKCSASTTSASILSVYPDLDAIGILYGYYLNSI